MITLYNEKNEKLKLISVFEFNDADMGESSISATVSFSEEQSFHPDWHVVYNGEKFYLGVRKPTGKKDTSSLSTTYTLVFKSEREDLKRYTFMDFVELGSGNPQPSSYNVPLYATLSEFVDRFNLNLRHYMGDRWRMVLPQDYTEDGNAISISFDNATLWDVLIKVYEIYGVRWVIRSAGNVLQIQVGFQEIEIEHVFEYGKDNGLVSVERNNALERIITRLRGRGSEKNLPPDYFHAGDPDTNSFLQATFFKNLMPKVYRDYVRGYNAGSGSGSWAYNQGVSDRAAGRHIAPIDYALSDKEDLWGISYGAMEPNEKIFPTLQGATRNGVRLDEVLAVEKVLVDGVKEPQNTIAIGIDAAGQESSSGKCGNSPKNNYLEDCRGGIEFTIFTDRFQVTNPINTAEIRITMSPSYIGDDGLPVPVEFGATSTVRSSAELQLVDFTNSITGEVVRSQTISDTDSYLWELDDIPSGDYRFKANVVWSANIQRAEYDPTASDVVVNVDTRLTGATVKEYARATDKGEWKETFDIEIRDVWGIARNADESDEDYTYRVWEPRAVSEDMTVMFSDGLLAGEDYEFRIVGFSSDSDNLYQVITTAIKPIEGGWRLTLQKSEAELEASNTYLPNTQQNAKPGDHFFFINISMPYDPYVYDAEARLNAYLEEQLAMKDEEFPSFTITPSKIFCSSFGEVDKIKAGAKIRVRNVALIGNSYISLYIQSLTKRYNANSLNPEWSLTLSDLVVASGNPVEVLEGQVNVLTQRVYSNRSAVQEAVRSLSSTFVRKDGIADVSYSPTEFKKNIKLGEGIADKGFRAGDIQGQGFGVYTDDDGNRVIEADVLVGRIGARFNEVVINQVSYSAGKQVFSAAGMVVSRVEDAGTSWRCYFDSKNGTVRNYFTVNDGAFSQRFTDAGIRQYWARVTAIGADYIEISKTDRMQGSFDPIAGDNVAQLGNSADKSRQAALMIDETHDGGGLVTWYDDITDFTLSNKDSVNIGRIGGKTWLQVYGAGYIGDREQTQYIKYENGVLQIKGRLEVGTKLSDGRDLEQAINEATPEGYEEFVESVTDDIDDIKVSVDGVEKSIEDIQKELDGAIETWFYEGVPTLANAPASDWTTDELKNVHLGDLYYDGVTGKAYRFQMDGSIYVWREITDTDIQAALEAASKAQDTADKKRRIFIVQPKPPYDEGDLWAGGKSEPLRRCIVARSSGSFSAEDWDYADNTQEQIAGYEYLKRALGESTTVEGGLIQSSLLMLGYTENGVFNIMSGTNGLYDATKKGGGIAAWYGGPMADIEADNTLVKYAQSLFRFDGSGYLAGGNITWDKDGAGSVAGGDLSWDKDGVITLGSAIKISGDVDATLGSILEYVNELRKLWSYDEENKAVHTTLNLIVDGGGAFGKGSGGGGDVPSGGIDEAQLWSILGQSGTQTIHSSHIPDLSGKYLSTSGGTINAASWKALVLDNSAKPTDGIALQLSISKTNKGGITYNGEAILLYNATSKQYLSIKDDGTPTYNGNTLIHSGNIGSQSVSYAIGATRLYANDRYGHGGDDPYYLQMRYNVLGDASWYLSAYPENPADISVSKARQLVTARTIWGQSFDGTGDVSGMLSGVNAIFFEPTKTYGIQRGSYYSASLTVDDIAIYAKKTILGGAGNVLVGTTIDSGYKLDVNGDLRATGNAVFDGAISTSANIINIRGSSSEQAINFIKDGVYRNQLAAYNDGFIIYSYRSSGKWGQDLIVYRETGNVEIQNNLVIGKASNTNWREITFNRSGNAGFIGHGSGMEMGFLDGYIQVKKDTLRFVNNSVVQTIYHSGNFNPADYLPLSGGTLTGDIRTKSYASGTDSLGLYIEGYSNLGLRIQYNKSTTGSDYDQILLKDGVLKFNSKEVIHYGNIGSYSGTIGAGDIVMNGNSVLSQSSATSELQLGGGIAKTATTAIYGTKVSLYSWAGGSTFYPLILNNNGNVLIGATTDISWAKLNVAGAVRINDYVSFYRNSTEYGYVGLGSSSINDIYLSSIGILHIQGINNITLNRSSNAGNVIIGAEEGVSNDKLYVKGKTRITGEFRSNINYITVNGSDIGWFGAPNDTSTTDYVCDLTSGNIRFNTVSKERLRITNGGNILISNSNLTVGDASALSYVMLNRGASKDGGIVFQEGGANRWQVVDLSDKSLAFYNYNVGKYTFKLGSTGVLTNTNYIRIQTNDWAAFEVDRGAAGISSIGGMDSSGVYFAHTKDGTTTYMYLKAGSGLSIHSNLTVTGGGAFGSDIRYKDIIAYQKIDLETIVNAPLFSFKWTDREDKATHLGTSAQYWLGTQAKDAVNITNPKFYHLDYGALAVGIGISVAREVKGVKTEVVLLRDEVRQLKEKLNKYEQVWHN